MLSKLSAADYYVFKHNGRLYWYEKEKLREWVRDNVDRIRDNTQGDGSKWIGVAGICPHEKTF